jgi:NAD(P)-dependent dehydrogenase (short-subunit alcohol dehydrogenase family)
MKQIVVITGAGTGIGALSSRTLAHAGHSVYATMRAPDGRNAERATALRDAGAGAAGELRVIELDVLSEQSAAAACGSPTCSPASGGRSRRQRAGDELTCRARAGDLLVF